MREHLETVARVTGKRPAELDVPDLPSLADDVWTVFIGLRQRSGGTGFGPAPIDERRLLDWQALHGQTLTPWEVEAIFALDALWMKAQAEARSQSE